MLPPSASVCVIGFGEAGSIVGAELAARGCAVRGFDLRLGDPATRADMQQRIEDAGVHPAATLADALRGAKLVICAVTADAARDVACSAAALLQRGQIFLDVSAAPAAAKRAHAALIEASGADYVDAALLAPLQTLRLAAPMQLGGPRAAQLAPALNAMGFDACAVSDRAGFNREPAASAVQPGAERIGRRQARRGELP